MATTVKAQVKKPVLASSGAYKSAYSNQIANLANKVANREAFSYDAANDPAYQAYASEYTRLGNQARENTLADVAGNTGGMASSYAASAAQQAQNNYNQQLTNVIPSLMEAAYSKYSNEANLNLNSLQGIQSLDSANYDRWNNDRNYNLDKFGQQSNNYYNSLGQNLDYLSYKENQRQFNKSYKKKK